MNSNVDDTQEMNYRENWYRRYNYKYRVVVMKILVKTIGWAGITIDMMQTIKKKKEQLLLPYKYYSKICKRLTRVKVIINVRRESRNIVNY